METTNYLFKLLKQHWRLDFIIAVALVLLFRIPYLIGDHVAFDGDEAVIGIMAQHLFSGEGYPFYFAGQRYGFSLIEVLSAALFLPLFGSTVWSLKAGGLLLYSFAVFIIARLAHQKGFSPYAYVLAVIFIASFPTWLIWGAKLRGGYQTAFLCLMALTYLHFVFENWSVKIWFIAAMLCSLIAVSQAFFILPVIFLLIRRFMVDTKISEKLRITGWSIICLSLLILPSLLNDNFWHGPRLLQFNFAGFNSHFVGGFLAHLAGSFAYADIYPLQRGKLILLLLIVVLAVSILYTLFNSTRKNRIEFCYLLSGTILSILPILFISSPSGRYLLPFYTSFILLFIWVLCSANCYRIPQLLAGMAALTVVVFAFSKKDITAHWLEPKLNDTIALNELLFAIESSNIQHVYCTNWELNWQINYLGKGKIKSRYFSKIDRFNDFANAVDSCQSETNCKTALVGTLWPLYNMNLEPEWKESAMKINPRYYYFPDFDARFLDIAGFER